MKAVLRLIDWSIKKIHALNFSVDYLKISNLNLIALYSRIHNLADSQKTKVRVFEKSVVTHHLIQKSTKETITNLYFFIQIKTFYQNEQSKHQSGLFTKFNKKQSR